VQNAALHRLEHAVDKHLEGIAYRFMNLEELNVLLSGDKSAWISFGHKNRKEVNEFSEHRSHDGLEASPFVLYLRQNARKDTRDENVKPELNHPQWSYDASSASDFEQLSRGLEGAEWFRQLGLPTNREGLRQFRNKIIEAANSFNSYSGRSPDFIEMIQWATKSSGPMKYYTEEEMIEEFGYDKMRLNTVRAFTNDPDWIMQPGNLRLLYKAATYTADTGMLNSQYRLVALFDKQAVAPKKGIGDLWPSLRSIEEAKQHLLAVVSLMPDREFRQEIEIVSQQSGAGAFPVFDQDCDLRFPKISSVDSTLQTELAKIHLPYSRTA
jgi:hypothetical protein